MHTVWVHSYKIQKQIESVCIRNAYLGGITTQQNREVSVTKQGDSISTLGTNRKGCDKEVMRERGSQCAGNVISRSA